MKSRLTSVLVRKTLQMEDVTRLEPKKKKKLKPCNVSRFNKKELKE